MPKKKAQGSTGRSLITIWYHLLSDPDATYHDLGADYTNGGPASAARPAATSVPSKGPAAKSPSNR